MRPVLCFPPKDKLCYGLRRKYKEARRPLPLRPILHCSGEFYSKLQDATSADSNDVRARGHSRSCTRKSNVSGKSYLSSHQSLFLFNVVSRPHAALAWKGSCCHWKSRKRMAQELSKGLGLGPQGCYGINRLHVRSRSSWNRYEYMYCISIVCQP